MFKKTAIAAFILGAVLTAAITFVAATSNPQIATDGNSLIVQNTAPLELTFTLETTGGETVQLGSAKPGELLTVKDALTNDGLLTTLKSDEFTIHAKDKHGSEFFTLMIDKDEVIQRQGVVPIPGPGGRRQDAALRDKPTVVPLPTAVP
jgi:hypothetical protein